MEFMKDLKIDFQSKENHLLLNPKLNGEDRVSFEKAWEFAVSELNLESHIAMATSGTTSLTGKLVLLSKAAFLDSAKSVNRHLELDENDIWLKALPRFHVGGLSILARAFLAQSKVFEYSDEKWSAESFHKVLTNSGATLISLVPTQVFDLVSRDLPAPLRVKYVIVGGAALSESIYLKAKELGWCLLPSYGMTETCSMIACADSKSPLPRILSHVQARLNAQAELEVSSTSLLTGYILKTKLSYEFIDPKFQDEKGETWFCTGDQAEISKQRLKILGRGSDFFKVGGEGVSLMRLENTLTRLALEAQLSEDAILLIVPDERLGSRVDLLTSAIDREKIQQLVEQFNASVSGFERIRKTHFVSQIPRTELGKLKRLEALAMVSSQTIQS